MSQCETCGGFVTDNYARVFGDNDDRVHECRHCPPDATRSTDETTDGETDERQVLLRDLRGGDAGDRSAERQGTQPTDGVSAGDGATGPDDTAETDTRGPAGEVPVTATHGSATEDGGRRSGLSAFLSALRS